MNTDTQQRRDRYMEPSRRPEQRALPTIHMFWHGSPLSRLERLCMSSFLAHGHPLDLYVYDEPAQPPPGVRLLEAERILSRDLLFQHKRTGSVAPFADWFRYRVLLQHGGIWADADVVCLQPLDYADPVIYAWQDASSVNNAVLGLPAGHALAEWLAAGCESPNRVLPYDGLRVRARKWRRRVLHGNRREKVRWGEYGPKGLTRAARHLGYLDKALPRWHFYPVLDRDWRVMFESHPDDTPLWPAESRAVHLWHNRLKQTPGLDKNAAFPEDSPFERLCRRYLAAPHEHSGACAGPTPVRAAPRSGTGTG